MNPLKYSPRRVEYLGLSDVGNHQLKVYSLKSPNYEKFALPTKQKIASLLLPGLPDPVLDTDHKVGFGILHWANDGLYTLTNTWYDANMLRMKAFKIDSFDSDKPCMHSLDHLNVIACVWELDIYKYERDLWVRTVLAREPTELTLEVLHDYFATGYQGFV
tara:strand:- start:4812 stop:5294 length:483 start_codon:yes stop_codon:yes gene_type:complete